MRERLEELNRELSRRGVALQMRIGLNTGEVVASAQAAEKGEFMVTGDAVNVAARLRGAAEPGMTIVGERTYWNTVAVAEYRPLSPLMLKGKALPVAAWELLGVLTEAARRGLRGLRSPMVGRDEEFALVQGILQRAIRERRPHLVTILGTPGVGKTRLIEEVQAALPPDVTVRQGRSLPYGSTSLWAVGEFIRADCGILRSDSLPLMTPKLEQRVADLWGEEGQSGEARLITAHIARILNIPGPATALPAETSREDLFWALRRYVERLGGRGPLLIVFEDLHWGDTELLDLIEYVAQWASGVPLLIICASRPELLEVRPAWGGGKRNYSSLFLEPLPHEHVLRLLQELLKLEQVPDGVASAVTAAEGNPFFVEEILRMLIDSGTLQRRDGRWEVAGPLTLTVPDTIQGVVTARLDRLSREEKTVLQEAAVLGTRFWTGGLAHVTGEGAKALLPLLTGLQGKDFIVEHPRSQLEGQREFAFKNLIIRDVSYAMLPKARRAESHGRFAGWLEQTYGDRAEEFADILAHHWGQAARLAQEIGLPDQWKEVAPIALRSALAAGRRAARVYAHEQARAHFEAARQLAADLGADGERIAAIEGLADVSALQAKWEEASRLYQEALAYHQQKGDAVRQARMQSRIGSTFASGVFDFRQAVRHVQSAMEVLEGRREPQELAALNIQMARIQSFMGDFARADAYARAGLALAEEHGLSAQVAEGRLYLAWNDVAMGRPQALETYPAAVADIERIGDPSRLVMGMYGLNVLYTGRGEYGQARQPLERALALASEMGHRTRISLSYVELGRLHLLTGDWTAARQALESYMRLSAEIPSWVKIVRSELAFLDGNLEEALQWSLRAVEDAEQRRELLEHGRVVDWCAFLHLRVGRAREAFDLLFRALEQHATMKTFWPPYLHPLAAEASLALGNLDAAEAHCAQAEALSWMRLRPAQAGLRRAQGLVRAAPREWDHAISLMSEAVDIYREIGQPYDQARALEALADLYRRRGGSGDERQAADALAEAVASYRRLGAEFELRRIGVQGSDEAPL
jgi:tetratricopeptide (TPR) repeat protein